jgi:hypothetical protein
MAAQGSTRDLTKDRNFFVNPLRMPCFRTSMLWGIACGTLMGAHRFRHTCMIFVLEMSAKYTLDNALLASDSAVRMFMASSTLTWYDFCVWNVYKI